MKILNQTSKGEIGRILIEEEWLTPEEIETLNQIKQSGVELKE